MRDFLVVDRAKLAAALPAMKANADRRIAACTAGAAISSCPHHPGSWVTVRWLEGWTGTVAPERHFVNGSFNMTPAEDVFRFSEWILGLGLPPEVVQANIASHRRSYAPEALAGNA